MRKIERQMIQAIVDRADWKSGNTEVEIYPGVDPMAMIMLHGNEIGSYDFNTMTLSISHAGWETNTTKSRLNALTSFVNGVSQVFQKKNVWYLHQINGPTVEMAEGFQTV